MGENISTRVAYGLALEEFGDRDNVYVFDADLYNDSVFFGEISGTLF